MFKIKPIFITGLPLTIVMALGGGLILFIDYYSQDKCCIVYILYSLLGMVFDG